MEVPGVDRDVACLRVANEDGEIVLVGFGLGEGVVQHDVGRVVHGSVGVELDDDDPILVGIEQVGQSDHDNVVIVDQRQPHWCPLSRHAAEGNHP